MTRDTGNAEIKIVDKICIGANLSTQHSAKIVLFSIIVFFLSACSLEASITEISSIINDISDPNQKTQRSDPDFVAGEVVTTSNGTIVTGSFGEVSERQTLSNGVVVEGVFYE